MLLAAWTSALHSSNLLTQLSNFKKVTICSGCSPCAGGREWVVVGGRRSREQEERTITGNGRVGRLEVYQCPYFVEETNSLDITAAVNTNQRNREREKERERLTQTPTHQIVCRRDICFAFQQLAHTCKPLRLLNIILLCGFMQRVPCLCGFGGWREEGMREGQ